MDARSLPSPPSLSPSMRRCNQRAQTHLDQQNGNGLGREAPLNVTLKRDDDEEDAKAERVVHDGRALSAVCE